MGNSQASTVDPHFASAFSALKLRRICCRKKNERITAISATDGSKLHPNPSGTGGSFPDAAVTSGEPIAAKD